MSAQVFPTLAGLGWSVTRDQIFMTRLQESISGKRTFIADQSYPRHKWSLIFNFLRQDVFNGQTYAEFDALYGFILARRGRFDSFLYQDVTDNAVTAQRLGNGDGGTTVFQLVRTLGGFAEPIFAPNVVSQVTVGGTPTTSYTLTTWGSPTPGQITFATAPAAGAAIAATFSYYWACTFSNDNASFANFMQGLWDAKKIEFETVK